MYFGSRLCFTLVINQFSIMPSKGRPKKRRRGTAVAEDDEEAVRYASHKTITIITASGATRTERIIVPVDLDSLSLVSHPLLPTPSTSRVPAQQEFAAYDPMPDEQDYNPMPDLPDGNPISAPPRTKKVSTPHYLWSMLETHFMVFRSSVITFKNLLIVLEVCWKQASIGKHGP